MKSDSFYKFKEAQHGLDDLNKTMAKLFNTPRKNAVLLCKGIEVATGIIDSTITCRGLQNKSVTVTATAETINATLKLRYF
jgi:hypothetical protein